MPTRIGGLLRNPFSFLFAKSGQEERLAAYVVREHERGRPLAEILNDRYLLNRATARQLERLLDRPEVVKALGDDAIEAARASIPQEG